MRTFELPEDAEPVLCLDLSSLSVVTSPGVGGTIAVEAEARLEPLLDVTADGAIVSVRQTVLLGRDGLGGGRVARSNRPSCQRNLRLCKAH